MPAGGLGPRFGRRDVVLLAHAARHTGHQGTSRKIFERRHSAAARRRRSTARYDSGGQQSGEHLHRHPGRTHHQPALHVRLGRHALSLRIGHRHLPAAAFRRDHPQGIRPEPPPAVRPYGSAPHPADALADAPLRLHPDPHEQHDQRTRRASQRDFARRAGRRRRHDRYRLGRGAQHALGHRQVRQHRGAGDHAWMSSPSESATTT